MQPFPPARDHQDHHRRQHQEHQEHQEQLLSPHEQDMFLSFLDEQLASLPPELDSRHWVSAAHPPLPPPPPAPSRSHHAPSTPWAQHPRSSSTTDTTPSTHGEPPPPTRTEKRRKSTTNTTNTTNTTSKTRRRPSKPSSMTSQTEGEAPLSENHTGTQHSVNVPGNGGGEDGMTHEQKRANHIASEQKRRQVLRDGYRLLTELVPALRQSMEPASRKEAVILQKTVEYMNSLLQERQQLRRDLVQLNLALGLEDAVVDSVSSYIGVVCNLYSQKLADRIQIRMSLLPTPQSHS